MGLYRDGSWGLQGLGFWAGGGNMAVGAVRGVVVR